jgi:ketosteroid isomerase-like protein
VGDHEIADRLALRALVDEYAWHTDRYDYDAYAALFTTDAEVTVTNAGETVPVVRQQGRTEIRDVLRRNDCFERTFHSVTNHVVNFSAPDAATGVTYCVAHHLCPPGASPRTVVMFIRYHDEYRRTKCRWQFASRRLEMAWLEHSDAVVAPYPSPPESAVWLQG